MRTIDAAWQHFDWEGRTIAWRRLGEGPPLVLCHGTPFSSFVWERYAAEAASEHTVHLWDMPGYGRSSKSPEHAVDLGVQGRALAALLEHWEVAEPTVVAHDFGGATALRAHLLHGSDYASLTLVDAVVLPPVLHRALVEAYIGGAAHCPLDPDALDRLVAPWSDDVGQAAFYAQIAQADERWTAELEDLLSEVRCPTSVIWGAEDALLPVEQAHRLAAALGAAGPIVLPGAGHLVQLDAPEPLSAALRSRRTREQPRRGGPAVP